MSRVSFSALRKYLLAGQLSSRGCLRRPISLERATPYTRLSFIRHLSTNEDPANTDNEAIVPLRKELKDEKKRKKILAKENGASKNNRQSLEDWELTVGIEIHAQLNTPRKLFSSAKSTINGEPNSHVALFDLAMPGTQPNFQKETLIPAIRAALALNCNIQETSTFDRKHYFHWDQPHGYQITQYYQPFAKDGYITLRSHDGIAPEDGDKITIGIKQIQMEQDTAKTIAQPDNIHLIDFNRVGVPLIEIITLPQIHHPATAAALVRKIQILLNSVDACVLGMESGGLRADVNVSVKRRNPYPESELVDTNSYAGITNLGQRTEIKNLSSHKAVEAAIIAERNRQIAVLEAGGVVESETRGWTLGSTETRRLRGKEGEVDYRYMPDADLAPVRIGKDLINHLKSTLGVLPDSELEILTSKYGLTPKDALSLMALEDGDRAEYFYHVVRCLGRLAVEALEEGLPENDDVLKDVLRPEMKWGKMAGNWVLHELGGLLSTNTDPDLPRFQTFIPPSHLAQILFYLSQKRITGKTAKALLSFVFQNPASSIEENEDSDYIKEIIERDNLWFKPMNAAEYRELAKDVVAREEKAWEDVVVGGREGKIMFLVGRMMKSDPDADGRVDGKVAEGVLRGMMVEERARRKAEGEVKGS